MITHLFQVAITIKVFRPVKYQDVTKFTLCNGMKLREGLFPVDIRRSSSGVKLLGGVVNRDADFISGLAMRRVANAIDLMSLLPQVHDPQTSRAQSWVLQDHILRNSDICGMDDDYVSALACLRDTIPSFDFSGFTNKDTTESSFLVSERTTCSGFLLVVPIDGLGQHMSPMEYNTILKYRLMIPLFPVDAICPICRKACLDSFGEHAVHCKELVRAGISAKKEALVNFLTDPSDGGSTLRPADVLVFGWVRGKHACVDLTRVFPLVGLSSRGFTAGQVRGGRASVRGTVAVRGVSTRQYE
ncbi:hypothetical protein Tco_1287679, partial [Tanacetum coccineum]